MPSKFTTTACDSFVLSEQDLPLSSKLATEGLFTLGSGYLHIRGSLEEAICNDPQNLSYMRLPGNVTAEQFTGGKQKWGTYIPGVFGSHPMLNRQMVNLPWFLGLELVTDGEKLDISQSRISEHRRALHLRQGVLERNLVWHTRQGAQIRVRFERFISAVRPQLLVQAVTLCAEKELTVQIIGTIDTDIRTSGHDHLVERHVSSSGLRAHAHVKTDTGIEVNIASLLRSACAMQPLDTRTSAQRAAACATIIIPAGEAITVEKLTAVSTSRDLEIYWPADKVLASASAVSLANLQAEHVATWAGRWSQCDVEIEGSSADQLAMRVSIYHLLRCHVPQDNRVAIDAKGYAGDAYFGRFFWDTEMYLMPFYLYTDPERARTLVEFRLTTLPGARANARLYGYPGARYAWESDDAGAENCPNWQYRDHEVHVSADVVYGWAHFDRAHAAGQFLPQTAEAIVETCRYWMARMDVRTGDDFPSLLGVMGPNEYAPISPNNAYTNRLVKFVLGLGAGELGQAGGASDAEQKAFQSAADKLPIPRSAVEPALVLENEIFEQLAPPRFDELWTDTTRGYYGQASQERIYRSQNLKQADVLMLMMLFPNEFSDSEVQTAWDYYLPKTTHDSSLSAGAHAIIACRLGLYQEAWRFWEMSSRIDIEGGAAQGIHIASCGVNWQIAVFGFAGISTAFVSEVLQLRPRLPAQWTRLAFPLVWKGTPVRIELTPGRTQVTNCGTAPLDIEIDGFKSTVAPSATCIAEESEVRR